MDRLFTKIAGRIAEVAGQPIAFILAVLLVLVWGITGPMFHFSETWQLVINTGTTIITFLMVFLVQNSQNRDAAAMQAKLDEIIRTVESARNEFIGIEHLPDTDIEKIRRKLEEDCGVDRDDAASTETSLARLIRRR
jgi:low affinity Fe/Cu permease